MFGPVKALHPGGLSVQPLYDKNIFEQIIIFKKYNLLANDVHSIPVFTESTGVSHDELSVSDLSKANKLFLKFHPIVLYSYR